MSDRPDAGVILVAALWMLVLLGLVAAGVIELARNEQRIARNISREAEGKALAEAGITRAIALLLDQGRTERWPIDGTARAIFYSGRRIEISIQDEFGKIDLNSAPEELLSGLLRSLGLREPEIETLIDRLSDWRDSDDQRRLNGAERDDYRAQGYRYGPRNGPFESVDELAQVMGFGPGIVERMRPALTVFSRRAAVDQNTAPREALLALPGTDDAVVRRILSNRNASQASNLAGIGTTASIPDLAGRAFALSASSEGRQGVEVRRTVVVRFTGDPNRPYWLHDWR